MPSEPFRILTVCTGNACRSPFAERYLSLALERAGHGNGVAVESAGIYAGMGHPAASSAVEVAGNYGVDLSAFASQPVTEELLLKQDLLLTLDETHDDYLLEHFPSIASKLRPLGAFAQPTPVRSIADPVGGERSVFESVLEQIAGAVDGLVSCWLDVKDRFSGEDKLWFAIGGDHRGYEMKKHIKEKLEGLGVHVLDVGTHDTTSCDHPDYAFQVGELVSLGQVDRGILICSSGHGMVIAVNKVLGIRAVVPFNEEHAEVARHHNNANVLCFPADYISRDVAERILQAFLYTEFLGGKYQRRINQISRAERVSAASRVQD